MNADMNDLAVGVTLYGYCEGVFGYTPGDKIVIAMGAGWLVAKNCVTHRFHFAQGDDLTILARHTQPTGDDKDY